ncbi:MAG: PQQ-binding-like beta-propeller repeat protein [Planctomycetes bacterium]|nr:PQQ-binding-like beta-propeller repeat protein [Planctomycetota bacterium]
MPILLGSDSERIRFAGAHSLFALKRATGQKAWQFGANDDEDPMADPEELETWTDHVAIAGRIISSSDRGDVVCINASTGTLQWRREIEGGTASHLAADGQFVYCAKWRGRNNVIHFLDAATGQSRGELSCEDSRPIQLLYPSADNGLLVIMAKSIMRIDPASLKIEWSIATPRHFLVSTFLHDEGGFILSDDARRIIKRDDVTGRLLWRSVPIGKDDRDGLWTVDRWPHHWSLAMSYLHSMPMAGCFGETTTVSACAGSLPS